MRPDLYSTFIGALFSTEHRFKNYSKFEEKLLDGKLSPVTYELASYQRSYRWDGEVRDEFFADIIKRQEPGYNFGFITLSQNNKNLEIIDGQQRITSTYLLLMGLYALAKKHDVPDEDVEVLNKVLFLNRTGRLFESPTSRTLKDINALFKLFKEQKLYEIKNGKKYEGLVFKNFLKFKKELYKELKDKKSKACYINEITKTVLGQEVIILKYKSTSSAISSFISLNMKSMSLDSFEVTSAYFLEKLNANRHDEIKEKLNDIYDDFEDLSNSLATKGDFEVYLRDIIIAKRYKEYSKNPKEINELKFGMRNNYIKSQSFTLTDKQNFLDNIIKSNKTLKSFYLDFKKDFQLNIERKFNRNNNIERKLQYIEFLINGPQGLKKGQVDFKKVHAHLNRYLMNLLMFDLDQALEEDINNSLNEIIKLLILYHFINIIGYNYKKARQSISSYLFENINKLTVLCDMDNSSSEGFLKTRKVLYHPIEYYTIEENKILSLIVISQIDFKKIDRIVQKNKKLNNQEFINIPSRTEYSKEHFIIDKSRYNKFTAPRDSLFNNCIYLDKKTNNEWGGSNDYKALKNKISCLKNNSTLVFNKIFAELLEKHLIQEVQEDKFKCYFEDSKKNLSNLSTEHYYDYQQNLNKKLKDISTEILKDFKVKFEIFRKITN